MTHQAVNMSNQQGEQKCFCTSHQVVQSERTHVSESMKKLRLREIIIWKKSGASITASVEKPYHAVNLSQSPYLSFLLMLLTINKSHYKRQDLVFVLLMHTVQD